MKISNAITLQDRFTPVMQKMLKAMTSTMNMMEKMNQTSNRGIATREFERCNNEIKRANNELIKFNNNTTRNQQSMRGLNNETSKVANNMKLMNAAAALNLAQQGARYGGQATDYLDEMTNSRAKLNLINDGLQTQAELQEKIFQSANRARMGYGDMATNVSKLNMLAPEQFKSNDEAIYFLETLNKMFKISGTSSQQASAATYQLTQAMASGRLQGDEYVSIMENAPKLGINIAKSMGKSIGELKKLSSEGKITAAVIKKAMFDSIEDVEKQFAKMPKTFRDSMVIASNYFKRELEPVSEKFSTLINKPGTQKTLTAIAKTLAFVGNVAYWCFDKITTGVEWASQKFYEFREPIMAATTIIGMLAMFYIPILITKLLTLAVAFLAVNWPILAIIAGIGLLIWAMNEMGVTAGEVVGNVCGTFEFMAAGIANIIIGIIDVFRWLGYQLDKIFNGITLLFFDLVGSALWAIEQIASGLEGLVNLIPFVEKDFTSGLEGIRKEVEGARAEVQKELDKPFKKSDKNDLTKAFDKGYKNGNKFVNDTKSKFEAIFGEKKTNDPLSRFDPNKFKINGGTLDEVGKIKGDVTITEEDIKMLKDVATQKYVNKYTTLRPNMTVKIDKVSKDVDVDEVINKIEDKLEEVVNSSRED